MIDYHGLLSIHMPGYYHSIIKGVATIMVSYSSWNGEKMHANQFLVTKFLKDILKFRVLVVNTDINSLNLCSSNAILKLLLYYSQNSRVLSSPTGKGLTGLLHLPIQIIQTRS